MTWVALCKERWIDPPDKIFTADDHADVVIAAKEWWGDQCGPSPDANHPWKDRDGYGSEVIDYNTDGLLTTVCLLDCGDGPTILFREADPLRRRSTS